MKRTSLVLAVVAGMVTVLVFATPAFAQQPACFENFGNACAPGPQHETGGYAEPQPPEDSTAELAAGEALFITGHGGPPGYHVLAATPYTPGECVQDPALCFS